MIRVNCPSCGAAIEFVSRASVSAVCAHCRSLVLRRDADVETLGTVARLPPDLSPVMIGTAGRLDTHGFTVVGRRRMSWADGGWNEWQLRLDGGEGAVLAEAQGRWTFCLSRPEKALPKWLRDNLTDSRPVQAIAALKAQEPLPAEVPHARLLVGTTVEAGAQRFRIADVKAARCIAAEGELFEDPRLGEAVLVVDALGATGAFLSAERHRGGIDVGIGRHARWPELAMQRSRTLAGWNELTDAG